MRSSRIVLHIQPLNWALRVAIAYSDGDVDVRDRITFQPVPDDEPDVVSGLITNEFGFLEPHPCTQKTFLLIVNWPNTCDRSTRGALTQLLCESVSRSRPSAKSGCLAVTQRQHG